MIAEAQVTVRNVSILIAQRGVHVLSGLLFAAIVPRLMGPETYGQYALITSLALWFVLFSGLGFTHVLSRYVPQLTLQPEKVSLQKLFGNLCVIRFLSGTLASGLYLIVALHWLHELNTWVLIIIAGTIVLRALVHLFFSLFLGLNQAARWGMGDILRRWLLLILLVPGFYLGGLVGASLGILMTELLLFCLGLWWVRSFLSWSNLRLHLYDVAHYLRFGFLFFVSTLLSTAFQYSGEALVQALSGDYVQVGYFRLAYDVYLSIASALPHFTLAFAPLLTTFLIRKQMDELQKWIAYLLKCLVIIGILMFFGTLLLGDNLVPLILGAHYQPVALNLLPLTFSLSTLALSSVAHLLALTHEKPRLALAASVIRLVTFWGLGIPLVSWWGSLGGCIAILVSSISYAAFFTWRIRRVIHYSLYQWGVVIGLASLFFPLVWLRASWMTNVALYGLFVGSYVSILFLLRVVTVEEIITAWRVISVRRPASKPPVGLQV